MTKPAEDPEREARIRDEATVDAHDEEERALGWYYYLDDKISFPFNGSCAVSVRTSTLKPGTHVTILKMAPEDVCMHAMFVTLEFDGAELDVPLSQITPDENSDDDTAEAIGDWHYWVARGYQF